jgi:hypothetical protein
MPPGTHAGVCAAADSGCPSIDTAPIDMPRNVRLSIPLMQCPKLEMRRLENAQPDSSEDGIAVKE